MTIDILPDDVLNNFSYSYSILIERHISIDSKLLHGHDIFPGSSIFSGGSIGLFTSSGGDIDWFKCAGGGDPSYLRRQTFST